MGYFVCNDLPKINSIRIASFVGLTSVRYQIWQMIFAGASKRIECGKISRGGIG